MGRALYIIRDGKPTYERATSAPVASEPEADEKKKNNRKKSRR